MSKALLSSALISRGTGLGPRVLRRAVFGTKPASRVSFSAKVLCQKAIKPVSSVGQVYKPAFSSSSSEQVQLWKQSSPGVRLPCHEHQLPLQVLADLDSIKLQKYVRVYGNWARDIVQQSTSPNKVLVPLV